MTIIIYLFILLYQYIKNSSYTHLYFKNLYHLTYHKYNKYDLCELNKIVSIKETSAIFLAIVLVLGTIALALPSFSVEAQATSDREKDYYNDEEKDSYEKDRDDKSRDYDEKDYDHDKDKKSYDKDDYKSEYSSYGKYDRGHDKSKKES